jgi:ribonuclease HIII
LSIEEKAKLKIEAYKNILLKEKFDFTSISKKNYNYELIVEENKTKVKVQVYFGKKGVKTILQGDEKSELHKKISSLISEEPFLDLKDPSINEPDEYIGTDECGKGDFFGPLVASAVYVNSETKKKLKRIGVRDSKDLSDYQILILAKQIKKIVGENFSVIKINPAKYNEIYNKLKNLNKLLNWAHSKAVDNLLDNIECKYIITDKFSNSELNISQLEKHNDVEFVQETKAEKYVGVAAASILARESFLEWFDSHAKKGKTFPKGSSEQVEVYGKNFLNKIGEDRMKEFVKLHFKTFNKIKMS